MMLYGLYKIEKYVFLTMKLNVVIKIILFMPLDFVYGEFCEIQHSVN